MNLPMRADLKVGNKFPDFELPDHNGEKRKLSQILRGMPGVLIFSRGHYCPKDRRRHTEYVKDLQPEFLVNYCKMITVSVDDEIHATDMRTALGANWPFLLDTDHKLLHELEMQDNTDEVHGEVFIPYTFILDGDRTIHKIYNGWWYLGRPTSEEIRMDLRAVLSKRENWVHPRGQNQKD